MASATPSLLPEKTSTVAHLFAGKPQAFGPRGAPSSIIKTAHNTINIVKDGALEDEQGNKKLHGGPYMALHQYAQESYDKLQSNFPNAQPSCLLGTIGENISTPYMNDQNVYIGDCYSFGEVVLKVVSPRAPCSKINQRYGQKKIDSFIAEHNLTGWYYSVENDGCINVGDDVTLLSRQSDAISIEQIWQLRKLMKIEKRVHDHEALLALANRAFDDPSLAPPWQADMHRVAKKLTRFL